jgi:hypothetical protein
MKRVIAAVLLTLLAVPAFALDIAKDPAVVVNGVQMNYEDTISRGDAAVLGLIQGTFTDLTGYYAAGLTAAGFTPDVLYDPAGGTDYSAYLIVFASASDNWWSSSPWATWHADLGAYMTAGGKVVAVGQDWLYGAASYTFQTTYLGMASVIEDVNYNDTTTMTWNGTNPGPLAGMTGSMIPCFASNPWFTDQITPSTQGLATWETTAYPGAKQGGCASAMGAFCVIEFGCGTVDAVGDLAAWFVTTATEDASLSAVKALY